MGFVWQGFVCHVEARTPLYPLVYSLDHLSLLRFLLSEAKTVWFGYSSGRGTVALSRRPKIVICTPHMTKSTLDLVRAVIQFEPF